MKPLVKQWSIISLLIAFVLSLLFLSSCNVSDAISFSDDRETNEGPDTSMYFTAIEDEPDTFDFQCTTIHYTIATNVFNRLVEMERDHDGNTVVTPSLAESWTVSEDRRSYTFKLRENITFSNGSPLTSSDVLYTFIRLLTYPDSVNRDIVRVISGAESLENGETSVLEGFKIIDDHIFIITLDEPYEAFLACLSMPGASIMDETTAKEAGERFGKDPEWTIGTGPFIIQEIEPGERMLLSANPDYFEGEPSCAGLDLRFMSEPEEIRMLFEEGGLDVISLDDVGNASEFFVHGDIYQNRLYKVPRLAISYIALNEAYSHLKDVRVRKAMQLALDRHMLLDAVYSGNGKVENGILPQGIYGYDPDLPEIPHDSKRARKLLHEAGYPDGFNLTISVNSTSTASEMTLIRLASSMWEQIGIHTRIQLLDESDFIGLRRAGKLECYFAAWSADFNDPDNFFYTFFGNSENSAFRSLNYSNEDVMNRVSLARAETAEEKRVREYRDLEKIIVQDDAAWIPLFSRNYLYVTSERVNGFSYSWSGSVKNNYKNFAVGGERKPGEF